MEQSTNVVRLRQLDDVDDPLTEVLRAGARQLLAQAVELEVEAFLAERADLKLPDGRARLVRHGHGPEREMQTGIGAVAVARPKIRDRGAAEGGERVRFTSTILPRWARRTRSLDALLPTLYLRGISTGDFQEALSALLGKDAPNLSPSVVGRLTAEWQAEYERWQARGRETFGRLAHPPGHAQADFGKAIAVIGGVRQKICFFCLDLPQSDACFVKPCPYDGGLPRRSRVGVRVL